jgi:hypothetical protein
MRTLRRAVRWTGWRDEALRVRLYAHSTARRGDELDGVIIDTRLREYAALVARLRGRS